MTGRRFHLTLALLAGTALSLAPGLSLAQEHTDLKKHDTSPGDQYQPSLDVLGESTLEAPGAKPGVPSMTQEEFEVASKIYFERCAGCHGTLRKGATGKALTPDITRELGMDYLKAFIDYGSPAGMPNWGTSGDFTGDEVDLMARYIMQDPVSPAGVRSSGDEGCMECHRAGGGETHRAAE